MVEEETYPTRFPRGKVDPMDLSFKSPSKELSHWKVVMKITSMSAALVVRRPP